MNNGRDGENVPQPDRLRNSQDMPGSIAYIRWSRHVVFYESEKVKTTVSYSGQVRPYITSAGRISPHKSPAGATFGSMCAGCENWEEEKRVWGRMSRLQKEGLF